MAAKTFPHRSRTYHRRCDRCFSRLYVAPNFAAMLTKASKGTSVRIPDGLSGDQIIEWFLLPWEEAVRLDSSFVDRHLHRPIALKFSVAGYPIGTKGSVVDVQVEPHPTFVIKTLDGSLLTVAVDNVLFESSH
jgi:hypothetical protein